MFRTSLRDAGETAAPARHGGAFARVGWWIALLAGAAATASADRPVLVGLHEAPPYAYRDELGKPTGFALEILEHIAAANGWTLEYVEGDWDENLDRLERGELDLLVPVSRTPERLAALDLSRQSLLSTWGQVFMRQGATEESLLELAGKRIAFVRGDAFARELRSLLELLELRFESIEVDDPALAFELVAEHQADAVAVERLDGQLRAREHALEGRPIIFLPTAARFAGPRGRSAELLGIIDSWLERAKAERGSFYDASFARWFGAHGGSVVPAWTTPLLLSLAGALLFSLTFVLVLRHQVAARTRELRQRNLQLRQEIGEREAVEAQLRQAQKMKAVGELAAGLAHDYNNFLTVIDGYTEVLLSDADVQVAESASHIQAAARRADTLTRQLLAFASKQPLKLERLHPNELLKAMEPLLVQALRADITLVFDCTPVLPEVEVDRGQLEQVVLNLMVNARDAMPDGGRLRVATELRRVEPGDRTLRPGEYVMVAVEDTGHGMDAVTALRVFEPFFTTKGRAGGTGLGLAVAYGIVRQVGGDLRVDSDPNVGTTFRILLPAADGLPDRNERGEIGGEETAAAARRPPSPSDDGPAPSAGSSGPAKR